MSFDNLVIIAAVAAAIPLLLGVTGLRIPGPVLEIVAGIVLGPAALGVLHVDDTVHAASVLGLAFLLVLAGLEVDVAHFSGDRRRALPSTPSTTCARRSRGLHRARHRGRVDSARRRSGAEPTAHRCRA